MAGDRCPDVRTILPTPFRGTQTSPTPSATPSSVGKPPDEIPNVIKSTAGSMPPPRVGEVPLRASVVNTDARYPVSYRHARIARVRNTLGQTPAERESVRVGTG